MVLERIALEAGEGLLASATRLGTRQMVSLAESEGVEAAGTMAREVATLGQSVRQVFIHSGEVASTDLAKDGPLTFIRTNAPDTLTWPKVPKVSASGNTLVFNEGGRLGYAYPPESPMRIANHVGAQSYGPHPFWDRINQAADGQFGRYPFRVNTAVTAPVANLTVDGSVESLTLPPKLSKNEISEAMAIAANAERIFTQEGAGEAASVLTKQSAGFIPHPIEVQAVSRSDFMRTALKGSSAWIRGEEGNLYTRFLRDWNGDFTRSDRTFLHSMFSNEKLLARQLPPGVMHPSNLSGLF
jgi:hypothetical protein